MNRPAANASLARTIATEVLLVEAFVDELRKEQQALQQGDVDTLEQIVEAKANVAARLDLQARVRNTLLQGAGEAPDRPGMAHWLASHPQDRMAADAWKRLQELAEEAHELNRVNGSLIQMRLQNNQKALSSLRAATGSAPLYGPDGMATSLGGRRIIDSA